MLETSPEPVRRLRVAGWAGILGGLAWGAVGALRQQSLAGPVFGLSHEVIGQATPALGLPGAAWTRRYAANLARSRDPAAGAVAAYAFDALVLKGDPQADLWLESLRTTLAVGGETVTSEVARTLEQLGYERSAKAWRPAAAPTSDDELAFEAEAIRAGVLPGNANSVL
jgi:hypothetical protein